MLELVVVNSTAMPDDAHPITTVFQAETGRPGLLICHNRQHSRTLHYDRSDPLPSGIYRDYKLQRSYYLNGIVGWQSYPGGPSELGAWYTALYGLNPDGQGPHWWRPLHTPGGAGWFNTDDQGQLRFRPLDHS